MEQGRAIAYVAEAPIIHVHDEAPQLVFNRYRREAIALRTLHPGERFHLWDFARLFGANLASDLVHASRERVLMREARGIVWFRWMQFWGTYRGFAHTGPLSGSLKQIFYYPREPAGSVAHLLTRQVPRIDYGTHGGKPK